MPVNPLSGMRRLHAIAQNKSKRLHAGTHFHQPVALAYMNQHKKLFLTVLLLTIATRLLTLGAYPLFETTESRYAEIARKMVETGNWVTPQISYGVPFWGKPPLSFWLTAGSLELFGVNDIAARLPSFVLAILVGWLIYHLALKQRGSSVALISLVVLSTGALFFFVAGQVMTDQALTLGTTLSMVAFWRALAETGPHGRLWGYAFFIGLAIGILAKGPVAVVLTLIPVGIWIAWHKKWRMLFARLPWALGTILMFIIAVPWYLLAEMRTPGFLHYFIVGEHWDRYLHSGWRGDLYGAAHMHARGMIWSYWIVAAFPWSLVFIVRLVRLATACKPSLPAIVQDEWLTYLILWTAGPLILFTFSANILLTYVLPGLPAFALLLAEVLQPRLPVETGPKSDFGNLGLAFLALPVPVIALSLVIFIVPDVAPYKSQKDVVARYKMLRSDSSSPLIYLFDKPYSAEFYSNGEAKQISDVDKAAKYVLGTKESFVVARDEDLDRMPRSLLRRLQPVARFGDCELLRTRPG